MQEWLVFEIVLLLYSKDIILHAIDTVRRRINLIIDNIIVIIVSTLLQRLIFLALVALAQSDQFVEIFP